MDNANHIDSELLERYSLDRLTEAAGAQIEEHLLICAECRDRLESMDAYHQAVRDALKQVDVKLSATAAQ
jgi:hypothetical protein